MSGYFPRDRNRSGLFNRENLTFFSAELRGCQCELFVISHRVCIGFDRCSLNQLIYD